MIVGPIYTIGHSTRPIDDLIELLWAHHVRTVADIRSIPRSRRNPQYEQSALTPSLAAAGLGYVHVPALGGRRHARHFAPPINAGLAQRYLSRLRRLHGHTRVRCRPGSLIELAARGGPVALMCAEAVPWRCHRSLVADALVATRGVPVTHILGPGSTREHELNPMARVVNSIVTYPAPEHAQ